MTHIEAAVWAEFPGAAVVPHIAAVQPQAGFWFQLSRTADVFTIFGIGVTVLALLIAFRQLKRTEQAEGAAARERQKVVREIALRRLMGYLPSLQKMKRELDVAVRENERAAVERELEEWCDSGARVKTMLARRADVPRTVVSNLNTSIALASTAKSELMDQSRDVISTTEQARSAIHKAGAGLTEILARLETLDEGAIEEEEAAEND